MTIVRPRHALALTAACAALAAGLTGCSGGGDGGGTDAADEWEPGVLDEYLARVYGFDYDDERSEEEQQAAMDEQNREVEQLVATCMQEQGFDYTPAVETGGSQVMSDDDLDVEWGSREFAEQYGYGISTSPWGTEDDSDVPVQVADPNEEYRNGMSESEQQAYDAALWGPPVDGDDPEAEYDWTTAGCYGEAQHEVYEGGQDTAAYAGLEDEVQQFWESIPEDPRMAELDASWASCMADEGYDGLSSTSTAQDALFEEYEEISGWNDPEYVAQSESWDWVAEPDGPPAPEVDQAAMDAFTDREIAQAVADHDCLQETDYTARTMEIDHELQQEFVDQHRTELEAWAEAAEAGRDQ